MSATTVQAVSGQARSTVTVVEETGADVLHQALVDHGYSQARFAEDSGLSRWRIHAVMAGQVEVPAAMAAAAEVVLDIPGLAEQVLVVQARAEALMALRTYRSAS